MITEPDPDPGWAPRRPGSHGRHRRPGRTSLIGLAVLVVAVTATVRLVTLPVPNVASAPAGTSVPAPAPALAEVWPGVTAVSQPAALPDGTAYTPALYLDPATSVGTADTPDGRTTRLLLRTGAATVRELQRVPVTDYPQYSGLVADGDQLVWALASSPGQEPVKTVLWRVNWRTGGPPARITADTGEAVFFQSQYDLIVADGRVHWAAIRVDGEPATELRSVPLAGGEVTVRSVPGAYQQAAAPWLVSVASGQATPVRVRDAVSGAETTVATNPTEVTVCGAVWCRVVIVSGQTGPNRLDLMRPDGSDRRRVAGSGSGGVLPDVALLDRFEPVGTVSASAEAVQSLHLYDLATGRTVLVADGVGSVRGGHGMLWWSAGEQELMTWNAIDLRAIPAATG